MREADPPALRVLMSMPDRAALFLDFDGTLADVVERPEDARPVSGAREVLVRLRHKFAIVAIVSGRPAGEVAERLQVPVEVWGVHGAERLVDGNIEIDHDLRRYLGLMQRVRQAAEEAVRAAPVAGLLVEDKRFSIALHYRTAADRAEGERFLSELCARLAADFGLTRGAGRLVFELHPPVTLSKATVVRRRGVGMAAACFVGDDRVDLAAFDALDELERDGVSALRVAVSSPEAPAELLERADLIVDGTGGVITFLSRLAEG